MRTPKYLYYFTWISNCRYYDEVTIEEIFTNKKECTKFINDLVKLGITNISEITVFKKD